MDGFLQSADGVYLIRVRSSPGGTRPTPGAPLEAHRRNGSKRTWVERQVQSMGW